MAIAEAKLVFVWRDEYNTGIREVDEQHKRLVKLINDLHLAMQDGKGKDVLGGILDQLVDYTKVHFRSEETMLMRQGYAGLGSHQKIHSNLTDQVIALRDKYRSGSLTLTMQTMTFLKDWLRNHILIEDMKYVTALKGAGK